MFCAGCGERMQRETVVVVSRGVGRRRSVALPGWYCWSCKASMKPPADLAEPAPKRLRLGRGGGLTLLRGWAGAVVTPDRPAASPARAR